MNFEEQTLSRKDIFCGRVISVHVDDILLSNGAEGQREVVEHPSAVCIAALTEKEELLFVTQYRYSLKQELLELPAGKLEKGVSVLDNAKRELREETGAIGKNYIYFGKMYASPGFSSEAIHLYFCEVESFGDASPDEDEFLSMERIPILKCVDMVRSNEITDGKTQLLILKTAAHLGVKI